MDNEIICSRSDSNASKANSVNSLAVYGEEEAEQR